MEEIITLRRDSLFLLQIVSPKFEPGAMRCGFPKQYGLALDFSNGETYSVIDVRSTLKIKAALLDWAEKRSSK